MRVRAVSHTFHSLSTRSGGASAAAHHAGLKNCGLTLKLTEPQLWWEAGS
jgi:hypothetical protein